MYADAERIAHWIETYEKDLLRLCFLYLKDASLAQDAVQETFLKAYRHLSSFRGDCSPRTWLARIAVNVCRDLSRTSWFRIVKKSVTLEQVQITQPDGMHEVRSELVAAIMRLPQPYKEVILLYYDENCTQEEIAHALHISTATVHRRLAKARALLKTTLKGENCDEA